MAAVADVLLPNRLAPGASVAVWAPSFPIGGQYPRCLARGVDALGRAGFRVALDPTCEVAGGLTALPPEELADRFHQLLLDPTVDAIVAAVGGWSVNSLLPHIDYDVVRRARKVIAGYSDISALLLAILARARLVTFHGPAVLPEWGEAGGVWPYTQEHFLRIVYGEGVPIELEPPPEYSDEFLAWEVDDSRPRAPKPAPPWESFRSGVATGPLVGGCMSTVALQLGTEFMPPLDGAILFLEEEGSTPDKHLAYLESYRQKGVFDRIAGLVVGRLSRPRSMGNGFSDMREPLRVALRDIDIPVAVDVDLGHTEPMVTLPMGGGRALGLFPASTTPVPRRTIRGRRRRRRSVVVIDLIHRALLASGMDVTAVASDDPTEAEAATGDKAPGVKRISRVVVALSDGSRRRYLVKTAREDGVRINECEGVVQLYRLSRFDPDAMGVWVFTGRRDEPAVIGTGQLQDLLLLEPRHDEPLLADLLVDLNDPASARTVGVALASHLQDRHQPVNLALDQYSRELIGGSFGLLATLDAFPPGLLSDEDYGTAAEFALRWVRRLQGGRPVRIHGDFHPWNVFMGADGKSIATTGGLHTSYGVAEDDIACMALNLRLLDRTGIALRSFLDAVSPEVSPLFGFFLGWRLLVLSNPLHYPSRSSAERASMYRAALFALAGEDLSTRLETALDQLLGSQTPWAFVDQAHEGRGDEAIYADAAVHSPMPITKEQLVAEAGTRVEVAGRIVAVRAMRHTVFVDIESEEVVQLAMALVECPLASRLRTGDVVGVAGCAGRTRSGEPSVLVERILWWHPCLLPLEVFESERRRKDEYVCQSNLLTLVREQMKRRGFAELLTDTLRTSFEGGRSRPFWTWSSAHGRRLYGRVTSELSLKGAVARGLSRVYELGPMYRNEAEDGRHLPEFLMLETYEAFGSLDDGVALVRDILQAADPTGPLMEFQTLHFRDAFSEVLGLDISDADAVGRVCAQFSIPWSDSPDGRLGSLHRLLRRHIAPRSRGILVVKGLPEGRSPMSRAEDGEYARAWIFANGVSVADVTLEETQPHTVIDLLRKQFSSDPYPVLRDYRSFARSMLLGLPPCVGVGMSISRALQVLRGIDSIRGTRLPT